MSGPFGKSCPNQWRLGLMTHPLKGWPWIEGMAGSTDQPAQPTGQSDGVGSFHRAVTPNWSKRFGVASAVLAVDQSTNSGTPQTLQPVTLPTEPPTVTRSRLENPHLGIIQVGFHIPVISLWLLVSHHLWWHPHHGCGRCITLVAIIACIPLVFLGEHHYWWWKMMVGYIHVAMIVGRLCQAGIPFSNHAKSVMNRIINHGKQVNVISPDHQLAIN